MEGSVILDLPANASIKVIGITNSGSYGQQIVVTPLGGTPVTWSSTGAALNKVVGALTIPKSAVQTSVTIQMAFNPGPGFQPSAIQLTTYGFPGLAGYVVGGQDSGARPNGPAYWNTVAFIYYAVGY